MTAQLSDADFAYAAECWIWDVIVGGETEAGDDLGIEHGVRGVALARREWVRSRLAHLDGPIIFDALATDSAERDQAFHAAGAAMSAVLVLCAQAAGLAA